MQTQAAKNTNITINTTSTATATATATPLDAKALAKLQELLNEVNNSGDFFKLSDGQMQEVTFNLNDTPGLRTRVIQT